VVFDMALALGAAGVFGAGLAPRRAAAAQMKLAQNEIGYQNTPKGPQRCDHRLNWLPPGSCKVVSGSVSPNGWCGLFQRKP
jgi:hypothetical protein